MAKKITGPQMIVANRLDDGRAVFFTGTGWHADAGRAAVAEGDAMDALTTSAEADAARNLVVGIERIEADTSGIIRPKHIKPLMQTRGPSVRTDLGYQVGLNWEE